MADLDDVIGRLPKLSADELAKVEQRIKALRGLTRSVGDGHGTHVHVMLDAIHDELVRRGVGCPRPGLLIRSEQCGEEFKKKVEQIFEVMRLGDLKLIERNAVLRIACRALANYLEQGIPVRWDDDERRYIRRPLVLDPRQMLIYVDRLTAAFDHEFPGYIRNGMLPLILARMGGPSLDEEG